MVKSLYKTNRQAQVIARGLQLTVDTEPADPVFTTAEAKGFLRVDYAADDAIIDRLVEGVTKLAEAETNRAFVTQILVAYWEAFGDYAVLPRPPHQTIDTVERWDPDTKAWVELQDTDYTVTPGPDYLTIRIPRVFTLGGISETPVRVTFTTGYGDAATDVPAGIRQAIIDSVTHCYQNRGEFQTEQGGVITAALTPTAKGLLAPYKFMAP